MMEELAKDEAERSRKEDEKRRKAALDKWRKFLMGMRIVERIKQDYGHLKDDVEVFGHQRNDDVDMQHANDDDMAGGFLPAGFEGSDEDEPKEAHRTSGFFPVVDEDEETARMPWRSITDTARIRVQHPGQIVCPRRRVTNRSERRPPKSRAKSGSARRKRRKVESSDEESEEEAYEDRNEEIDSSHNESDEYEE